MKTNNAILVYTEEGAVKHRFCQEDEARAILADMSDKMEAGSLFVVDQMDAQLVYDVSPDLRGRVAAAKTKHKAQARIKMALDRHGVSPDRDIRIAIFNAFEDLTSLQKPQPVPAPSPMAGASSFPPHAPHFSLQANHTRRAPCLRIKSSNPAMIISKAWPWPVFTFICSAKKVKKWQTTWSAVF